MLFARPAGRSRLHGQYTAHSVPKSVTEHRTDTQHAQKGISGFHQLPQRHASRAPAGFRQAVDAADEWPAEGMSMFLRTPIPDRDPLSRDVLRRNVTRATTSSVEKRRCRFPAQPMRFVVLIHAVHTIVRSFRVICPVSSFCFSSSASRAISGLISAMASSATSYPACRIQSFAIRISAARTCSGESEP